MLASQGGLDLSRCPDCTCFHLRKATRAITQLFDTALQSSGLLATQFTVLVNVNSLGPVTISDLARRLVMDRTTLSRDLKPLARRGLVKIQPGEDRRFREVGITAAGRRALARALPLWKETQAAVIEGLGQSRWRDLLEGLAATVSVARRR